MSNGGNKTENNTKTGEFSEGNSRSYKTDSNPSSVTPRPDSRPSGQGDTGSATGNTSTDTSGSSAGSDND
jgi:hypothetical protein